MNHELNMQIAEFMGWTDFTVEYLYHTAPPVVWGIRPDSKSGIKELVPDFPGSLDAAFEMEAEIERLGLWDAYVAALERLTEVYIHNRVGSDAIYIQWPRPIDLWQLIYAAPEQRCKAALEAVREKT